MLGSHRIPQTRDPDPFPFRGGDRRFQTLENKSQIKNKNNVFCLKILRARDAIGLNAAFYYETEFKLGWFGFCTPPHIVLGIKGSVVLVIMV